MYSRVLRKVSRDPKVMGEHKTKGIQLMSRMKSIFAVLVLTAIVGVVPQAYAAPTITLKVVAAGSSAMWQTMALGAFNNQVSIVSGGGVSFHPTNGAHQNKTSDTPPPARVNNQTPTPPLVSGVSTTPH